jgi:hypothetical protein
MTARGWYEAILFSLAVCSAAAPAKAQDPGTGGGDLAPQSVPTETLPELRSLFDELPAQPGPSHPDWIRRTSSWVLERYRSAIDDWHLAVQKERADGTDLFTIRHPLADLGPLQTYAGAGFNRTVYFADAESGPNMLGRHNRHRGLGAAAEIGAELRLSEALQLRADLRWIDLSSEATVLRSGDNLVGADAVAFGLSVGWRFP